jgi:hypothetical protein
MIKTGALYAALVFSPLFGPLAGQTPREPHTFFKQQIGLTDDQIANIRRGRPVVKVLPANHPSELLVFGAVFVHATPEEYTRLAFDMARLRSSPNYLAVGRFHDPPQYADLAGFDLEPDDIASLRSCKPGKCDVQLPAKLMHELQSALDWSAPNLAVQVNDRVRMMALNLLRQYQREGNRVLGTYHDTGEAFDVGVEFRALMARAQALPVYLPDLGHYLLEYPQATLANAESVFYWERVNFGLKPTLRLNHAVAYRSSGPRGSAQVVAVKQLYASHYLQLALDLTACVPENGGHAGNGFYLITLKGSTQQGLTGFTGSILRRIIVSRTRAAQERMLFNIKRTLEQKK